MQLIAELDDPNRLLSITEPIALLESLSALLSIPSVRWLLLASGLRFLAGFTISVWIVPFYRGAFPDQVCGEYSIEL